MAEAVTSRDLITEKDVIDVLRTDKGDDVILKSWTIQDFTKKGDNFATTVTSIIVTYCTRKEEEEKEEEEESVSYVVKCNPCRQNKAFEPYTRFQFEKEGRFYCELAQPLDAVLRKMGEPGLRIPRCLLVRLPERREVIIFEDLRCKGFVMANRKRGLNESQVLLVIKELARMHASSLIHKKEAVSWEDLIIKHGYLKRDRMNYDEFAGEKFRVMFSMVLENAQQVLQKVGGYDEAVLWLSKVKDNLLELYEDQLADSPKFNVICHGDCWVNNILFRYNKSRDPQEAMLLDLQMCRLASLATDLNYFIYSSVEGPVRTKHLENFLSTYYNTFRGVLASGGLEVSFTLAQLHQEFRSKNLLGAITAFTILPAVLMPANEVLDYTNMKEGGLKDFMLLWREKMLDMVDTNPLMKTWFVGLFDELKDVGLIRV